MINVFCVIDDNRWKEVFTANKVIAYQMRRSEGSHRAQYKRKKQPHILICEVETITTWFMSIRLPCGIWRALVVVQSFVGDAAFGETFC